MASQQLCTMLTLMTDSHVLVVAELLGLCPDTDCMQQDLDADAIDELRDQLLALCLRDAESRQTLAKFYHTAVATPEPVRRELVGPPPVRHPKFKSRIYSVACEPPCLRRVKRCLAY